MSLEGTAMLMAEMSEADVRKMIREEAALAAAPVLAEIRKINGRVTGLEDKEHARELAEAMEQGLREGRAQTLITKGQLAVLASVMGIVAAAASVVGALVAQQ